jgi:hypothetical protein
MKWTIYTAFYLPEDGLRVTGARQHKRRRIEASEIPDHVKQEFGITAAGRMPYIPRQAYTRTRPMGYAFTMEVTE